MTRRQIFIRGIVAGLLLGLVAQAVNWLFSAHADASDARRMAVMLQAMLSAIGAVWLARGIPGEPEGHALQSQQLSHPTDDVGALTAGAWPKSEASSFASSPSPVPENRHT